MTSHAEKSHQQLLNEYAQQAAYDEVEIALQEEVLSRMVSEATELAEAIKRLKPISWVVARDLKKLIDSKVSYGISPSPTWKKDKN